MTAGPFWAEPADAVLRSVNSTAAGLSSEAAQAALGRVGPNRIRAEARVTRLGLFLDQFKSPIVLILIAATIVSAFLQDWADAIIILLIVLGSALLSFSQEYNAHNAAEKLKGQIAFKAEVLRDGKTVALPTAEIVPGDVVLLSAGSLIPADGLVLEARDFFVNQAVLTGETFPVEKQPGVVPADAGLAARTNVVFMGTNVRSGSARALIVQTGAQTAFGQIAGRLALRPPETEFQHGVRRLGYLLTEVMFLLVLGIFFFNVLFHKPPLDSLLFSIALAVGLTPQLLPAIININLSKGAQQMAQHGVIVRRLESIENFGSMDILCTDKTGTLTEGVVQLDGALDVYGEPSAQVGLYAYLNASLQTGLANPLDEAIVRGGAQGAAAYAKVDELPYDFTRKRLTVVVQEGAAYRMITKGALDNVLAACSRAQVGEGTEALDAEMQAAIRQRYAAWSDQGYRVLGVAVRPVDGRTQPFTVADETDMTFAGFLLFFDPPKAGVQETVRALARLGVRLKVITGDNKLAARHTGQAVGLGDAQVLTGGELDELRDEALWHAVEDTTIFAEVDPNQKERIILALKKRGHVVGYMGDGINDAPSLHAADVGISVANAVDVAKEAADLVLLKQDLDVLREGIVRGRMTFANTLKYVFMAVSANFGNMFSMAGASLFLPFLPMLPKQILLINFLTDLPEMTIAGDRVDDVMVDRPHRIDIRFIRRFMLVFGPLSSLFDYATFGVLLWLMKADQQSFQTGWFIESILSAGVVVFALRTRLPFLRSRPSRAMLLVTAAVMLLTLGLPYSPLARVLGFTPLPPLYLLFIFGIVALYLTAAELTKRWFYRRYGAGGREAATGGL
ncbi:MAG: Magnesium-transporting ATPase, P-type 1 [Chloroflexi bacterium ADurb.Bin325]|nr:MAG: Magnesium-transporting ATPase, P-type 1 [Chloroflexi bacterium ADurb.Bin325]